MGVSVRVSRNTRVYLPFWIAIPAWLIAAAIWVVIICAMVLWWLLVTVPGKAISASRARRAARPPADPARAADRIEEARHRQDRFQASRQAYGQDREAGRQEHLDRRASRREAARQPAAERRGRHHAGRARRGRLSWPGYGIISTAAAFVTGIVLAGAAGGNQHSPLVTAGALLWIAAILMVLVCVPAALWRKYRRTRPRTRAPRTRTVTPGFEAAHGLTPAPPPGDL
jgi:hypothetical protein